MKPSTEPDQSPFRSPGDRIEERERKREAVLVAAVRMFNSRGFHATSLDDVAVSLGVTRPVVYHYLGNKDQVLFECVRRGLEQLQDAARKASNHPGNGPARLRAFLIRYAEINMDDFGRCVIRTGDELLSDESATRFRSLKREVDQSLRALIEDAVWDGSLATTDVRFTAFALAGALNWPARWYRPDGTETAGEVAEKLVDILLRGLLPTSAC